MQAKNERGPSGGRSPNNHDRAESQVRHQGDRQAPIRHSGVRIVLLINFPDIDSAT